MRKGTKMKIDYKVDDSVSIGKVKGVKEAIRTYKQNPWETEQKVRDALRGFLKKYDSFISEVFSCEITGYENGFIVNVVANFLKRSEELRECYIRAIFELEKGAYDEKAIIRIFEQTNC